MRKSRKKNGRQPENRATVEHLLPRSKGGGDNPENLAVACVRCNWLRDDSCGPPPLPEDQLVGEMSLAWKEGKRWCSGDCECKCVQDKEEDPPAEIACR